MHERQHENNLCIRLEHPSYRSGMEFQANEVKFTIPLTRYPLGLVVREQVTRKSANIETMCRFVTPACSSQPHICTACSVKDMRLQIAHTLKQRSHWGDIGCLQHSIVRRRLQEISNAAPTGDGYIKVAEDSIWPLSVFAIYTRNPIKINKIMGAIIVGAFINKAFTTFKTRVKITSSLVCSPTTCTTRVANPLSG